ncbi:MAG: hypothetical protein KJ043_02700 [Anaerolineae bacterium]|nr:hypothetical protein [Anaerolineae bacterium]
MKISKKQQVLIDIFTHCVETNQFEFDNELVKEIAQKHGFGNPFDATKIDSSSALPQIIRDEDYFLIHLGEGKHRFIKGISDGYHPFEAITESIEWAYIPSILNDTDTSESNVLSVIANQGVLHQFIYNEQSSQKIKIYYPRRSKITIDCKIGQIPVLLNKVQIEVDLTTEYQGHVVVYEAKNKLTDDFAVYQLYYPLRYYVNLAKEQNLPIQSITCCYVLRQKFKNHSLIRLYHYTFDDIYQMNSIRLMKSCEYVLRKES